MSLTKRIQSSVSTAFIVHFLFIGITYFCVRTFMNVSNKMFGEDAPWHPWLLFVYDDGWTLVLIPLAMIAWYVWLKLRGDRYQWLFHTVNAGLICVLGFMMFWSVGYALVGPYYPGIMVKVADSQVEHDERHQK